MRRFTGHGGNLFLVADPHLFEAAPMEDCGDGFDWRMADPALRHWDEKGEFTFAVYEQGGWWQEHPEKICFSSGRVSFTRCISGKSVQASGVCYPLSLIAEGSNWQLAADYKIEHLGDYGDYDQNVASFRGFTAQIRGLNRKPAAGEKVLVCLPTAGNAFIGEGEVLSVEEVVNINFNEKGVKYEPV